MKKDIKNVQASIRSKLQNKAKETNRPFAEVLQGKTRGRFVCHILRIYIYLIESPPEDNRISLFRFVYILMLIRQRF